MFAYRETVEGDLGNIEVAFTDSATDFGDVQGLPALGEAVARLRDSCGAQPVLMNQVHGTRVHFVDDGQTATRPTVDALVTGQHEVAAVVRVADCVPVLLADPTARVIGAAHAGRVGLVEGIIPATLAEMRRRGATEIHAWVGPHICGNCYEVPEAMQSEVSAELPETRTTTRWGTPALDLGAGVTAQLTAGGCSVTDVSNCTFEDRQWHSFRRDGPGAGRMAGLIWIGR